MKQKVLKKYFLEDDTKLLTLAELLVKVNKRYYKESNHSTIAEILKDVRLDVLKGCTVIFSGYIPIGTDPESFAGWKNAMYFGANCTNEISSLVTHIITPSITRDKVKKALVVPNIQVVTIDWLNSCCENWTRVDENLYRPKDINLINKRKQEEEKEKDESNKKIKEDKVDESK